jgi:hypothetical protein
MGVYKSWISKLLGCSDFVMVGHGRGFRGIWFCSYLVVVGLGGGLGVLFKSIHGWVLVLGLLSCAAAWYVEPFCGVLVGIIGRKWKKRGEYCNVFLIFCYIEL